MKKFLFYQEIEIALVVSGSNSNANTEKGESEIIDTAGYNIAYLQMWRW